MLLSRVLAGLGACAAIFGAIAGRAGAAETPLFVGSEPIPADAVVLFDGKDLSQWTYVDGSPANWKVQDGWAEARGGNIRSKQEFGDHQLHVEFWLPVMNGAQGQGRANSGVYLQGSYEIQVLDSYGLKPGPGDCGAIYGVGPAMVNACRPAGTWQSFDIFFRAPKFNADGSKAADARVTILQNGVLIHEHAAIPGPTAAGIERDITKPGPVMLQDHGNPVRFRNIWVRPLGAQKIERARVARRTLSGEERSQRKVA